MKKVCITIFFVIVLMVLSMNIAYAAETRGSTLDLTGEIESADVQKKEGWNWMAEQKTLTLRDFNLKVENENGIILPDGDVNIILYGENNIEIVGEKDYTGILSKSGNITFMNEGKINLKITSGTSNGFFVEKGDLLIDRANVAMNINSKGNSTGIYNSGKTTIRYTKVNIKIASESGEVKGITCTDNLAVQVSDFNIDLQTKGNKSLCIDAYNNLALSTVKSVIKSEASNYSGNILSRGIFNLTASELTASSKTITTEVKDEEIIGLDKFEEISSISYGIWAGKEFYAIESIANLDISSKATPTLGTGIKDYGYMGNNVLNMKVDNSSETFDYGIFSLNSFHLFGGRTNVETKGKLIASINELIVNEESFNEDGEILETEEGEKVVVPKNQVEGENKLEISKHYKISMSKSENGKITTESETYEAAEEVEIKVSPKFGYKLIEGSLEYNDTVIKKKDGKYVFITPALDVIITAEFEQAPIVWLYVALGIAILITTIIVLIKFFKKDKKQKNVE